MQSKSFDRLFKTALASIIIIFLAIIGGTIFTALYVKENGVKGAAEAVWEGSGSNEED